MIRRTIAAGGKRDEPVRDRTVRLIGDVAAAEDCLLVASDSGSTS